MTISRTIRPGYRSGRWTVTGFPTEKGRTPVVCECGKTHTLSEKTLIARTSYQCLSCHAKSRHRSTLSDIMGEETYRTLLSRYHGIRSRCENEADPDFRWYGGRGIAVGFADADHYIGHVYFGLGFTHGCDLEIDRIDNDGDYAPGNLRLATRTEQNINRSNTVWLRFGDGEIHATEFWRRYIDGVASLRTFFRWVHSGMSADDIIAHAYGLKLAPSEGWVIPVEISEEEAAALISLAEALKSSPHHGRLIRARSS